MRMSRGRVMMMLMSLACMQATQAAEEEKIPIKINVGAGYSTYRIADVYEHQDSLITGTELSLSGVVEQEVLKRFDDKIPKAFRKPVTGLSEVSATHWLIPQTLYIHPDDGTKSAYGATWGIVPGFQFGTSLLSIGLNGGVIATYLYHSDKQLNKTVHFIRPGLRGSVNVSVPLIKKYLIFEAGFKEDIYWSKAFYGSKNVWHFSGTYGMLHVRIPLTISARI